MKKKWRNHHHLQNKSKGGSGHKQNLLLIDGNLHQRWHLVFGNHNLDEIIALLQRVKRAKEAQK